MKKLLGFSVLALALVLGAQQQASAWSNIRFGIGANLAWQTGNNSALWGLWRDGNVPGAPTDVFWRGHGQGGYGGGGYGGGGYGGYGAGGFGGYGNPGFGPAGPANPAPGATPPAPMGYGQGGYGNTAPVPYQGTGITAPPVSAEPPMAPTPRGETEQVGYSYYEYAVPATYNYQGR